MSPALRTALTELDGRWLVEEPSGLVWNGLSGRVADFADPLGITAPAAPLAPTFTAAPAPDVTEVVLSASVRHRQGVSPTYGALLESFTSALGAGPAAFGPSEPTAHRWDRADLEGLLSPTPEALRLFVESEREGAMRGSLLVRATTYGAEEVVDGALTAPLESPDLASRVCGALADAAATSFTLFAVVLARPGYADLMERPYQRARPAPLAVFIGPPGVRDLGVNVDRLVEGFGALRVGSPRVPGVLIPFSGASSDWAAVGELVDLLGRDRVAATFGRSLRAGG